MPLRTRFRAQLPLLVARLRLWVRLLVTSSCLRLLVARLRLWVRLLVARLRLWVRLLVARLRVWTWGGSLWLWLLVARLLLWVLLLVATTLRRRRAVLSNAAVWALGNWCATR